MELGGANINTSPEFGVGINPALVWLFIFNKDYL
jgi:hypothetical protein